MINLTALDGRILPIDDDSVLIVAGPSPGEPADRCYVTGPAAAPIATNEAAAALVARLRPATPLAALTRPNRTPVWIKGAAVGLVRAPDAGDIPPGETVGAVLQIEQHHQAVAEPVATVRAIINAHGGRV